MKKFLSNVVAVFLAVCTGIGFIGCSSSEDEGRDYNYTYCDPRGVEWYNEESLPNIEEPFVEVYDGTYTIEIDKNEDVLFKLPDGEELKGKLSVALNRRRPVTDVTIEFENGKTAEGSCFKNEYGRYLSIWYNYKQYVFDEERDFTKEEFEEYRGQFVDFLLGVYETGYFPTEEEIAKNEMYRKFTHYFQIDPHCGGPITYSTVEKATIKRIYSREYEEEVELEIDGKTVSCSQYHPVVALITQSGEIQRLTYDDVKEGDCLVRRQKKADGTYSIKGIFYIESGENS